jgi:hypothetical protein
VPAAPTVDINPVVPSPGGAGDSDAAKAEAKEQAYEAYVDLMDNQSTPEQREEFHDRIRAEQRGEERPDQQGRRGRNRQNAQQRISALTAKLRQTEVERNLAIQRAEQLSRPLRSDRHASALSFDESETLRLRNAMRAEQCHRPGNRSALASTFAAKT